MALTYTVFDKVQAAGVGATITSPTLSGINPGGYINLALSYGDNGASTAWNITNDGSGITWTKKVETNTALNNKIVVFEGVAGATPPTTISVQTTAGNDINGTKVMKVIAHDGAHATTPMPAGNIFSGVNGTDVSQSITPTSAAAGATVTIGGQNFGASGATVLFDGASITPTSNNQQVTTSNPSVQTVTPTTPPDPPTFEAQGTPNFFINGRQLTGAQPEANFVAAIDRAMAEDDGEHEPRTSSGEIALARGLHPVRVTYFQGTEGKELHLDVEGPSLPLGPIELVTATKHEMRRGR